MKFLILLLIVAQCQSQSQQNGAEYHQRIPLEDLKVKVMYEAPTCGETAEPGDLLTVHYIAKVNDEFGRTIEHTRDRGSPLVFQLGAGQVPKGIEQGVVGMCEKEIRQLDTPARLSFGDVGVPHLGVPGGSDIYFLVEVIEIKKGSLDENVAKNQEL